ncbi:MAG: DUF4330 domain-containing protein [Clostridia bacterium]|nr:DUF4330 domain-containing protein [Clostridia bacterium]
MKKEKTQKKSGRRGLNVADIIVIVLVLACVALAVWIFGGSGIFGSSEKVTIEYELWIVDIRNDIASHIKPGAEVTEASRHYHIGTIGDSFNTEPYTYEVYLDELYDENGNPVEGVTDGERVEVEKPGYVSVVLPITAEATVEEDGYYVNGFRICVGGLVYIRTPDFAGAGHVISINVSEGGAAK